MSNAFKILIIDDDELRESLSEQLTLHEEYWPAQYIVDSSGQIVFEHAGEGQYDEIERTIQRLLDHKS